MKASIIVVLLGVVAMLSMFSVQPFGEFMLFTNVMLCLVKVVSFYETFLFKV